VAPRILFLLHSIGASIMSNDQIVYPEKKSKNQQLPDKIVIPTGQAPGAAPTGPIVMTRAKPSSVINPLDMEGLRPSGFCQVHGRKLTTAPDGSRYCLACAGRAYRQEQQAKVEESSAKMVRGR
jgi:hypothetical protein